MAYLNKALTDLLKFDNQFGKISGENGETTAPMSIVSVSDLDGNNGFSISGISRLDFSGSIVSGAGDINGDGYDDFIIGAAYADPYGNTNAGQAYIVFGNASGISANLNLSDLDGSNGFSLNGINLGDGAGHSVSGLGDVNGDGIDDFIIGAPNVANGSGDSYVVFGSADGHSGSFSLTEINGTNGFVLYGDAVNDQSGFSVSDAGDINGDGIADILVGARGIDGTATRTGEAYVVFGSNDGFHPNLYLNSLDGDNGFAIISADGGMELGYSVSAAGDVNGDGIDDVLIGAAGTMIGESRPAGEVYVVFGSQDGFSSTIDLASLDGSNGYVINGLRGGGYRGKIDGTGGAISSAGDVNNDGIDDILVGAWASNIYSGQAYVIFGSTDGHNGSFDLTNSNGGINLDGSNGFMIRGLRDSQIGRSVSSAGDVNGDGIDDFIIGSRGGTTNSGSTGAYLIFGSTDGFDALLNLEDLDAHDGFLISTLALTSGGLSVSGAGDINADGFDDILIGNPSETVNGIAQAGQSYIVYGSAEFGRNSTTLGDGNDNYSVSGGSEVVYAGGGDDIIDGLDGNDYLFGGDGQDDLYAGRGNDTLDGGLGNDILNGGAGDDILRGGAGDDILIGADGSDTLHGEDGNDYITGRIGDDHLYGGDGADIFVILANAGNDVIYDFTDGVDRIEFTDSVGFFEDLGFIQDGDNVLIKSANGITTLIGMDVDDIDADDFIFRRWSETETQEKVSIPAPELSATGTPAAALESVETPLDIQNDAGEWAFDFSAFDMIWAEFSFVL